MSANWEEVLKDRLPLYGHRNWIVFADSAYPAQSSQGIETVVAHEGHPTVLARGLSLLRECKHIKPIVYVDHELTFVAEEDAHGVTSIRKQLATLLEGHTVRVLPHEEIISKLDRVGQMFRVLLIKTDLCIPYTSVFLELECGYWNSEAERRLRSATRSKAGARKSAKKKRGLNWPVRRVRS